MGIPAIFDLSTVSALPLKAAQKASRYQGLAGLGPSPTALAACSICVEDEMHRLRENIERYSRLFRYVADDRVCHELEQLLREARERLKDIDRRS